MLLYPCYPSGGGFKDPTSSGRDLTKIFAQEIANFPSPWDWIQNRINNRNYRGLKEEDFIPMTVNGETHEMQIAGINTYKGTADIIVDDHIDFISRDCYKSPTMWKTANNNNGTAEQKYPYQGSHVYAFLGGLYEMLPTEVKNVIAPKRIMFEERYSSSGVLTESTGWAWDYLQKLWLPSEYEVCGSVIWGTKGYSAGQAVQYPIFINSWKNRIKGAGSNGARCNWWLLTVAGVNSTSACIMSNVGVISNGSVTGGHYVPICFRIMRQL